MSVFYLLNIVFLSQSRICILLGKVVNRFFPAFLLSKYKANDCAMTIAIVHISFENL